MTTMGALWVRGIDSARAYGSTDRLDVPGRPQVVFTPGHTHGHCSLLFADRGAVIVGDAFVMLDPYSGRSGPCVVAGAATADSARAMSSLGALADLDATTARRCERLHLRSVVGAAVRAYLGIRDRAARA